ncbi:MAG: GntR family transcriptional regulator [Pirellulales bacterium]
MDQPTIAPSPRGLLKEQAYAELRRRILDGSLAGGDFLSERRLAEVLNMSKTPIKAALERLEHEGLIVVSPQQGIVVRELTIREIADQFELRKALEGHVVRSMAGRLTPDQLAPLAHNLDAQSAAAQLADVARLVDLDATFHLLLCQTFGNAAITACLAEHRARMHRVIFQVMSQVAGRLPQAVAEHQAIFAAIRDGRDEQAVQLIQQHLEFGKQFLLASRWD